MQENSSGDVQEGKPKRGRPKKSALSSNEQVKLRMQRLRERKRQEKLVPVQIWIPEGLKEIFTKNGEDLSQAGNEAFEILARKRGYLEK